MQDNDLDEARKRQTFYQSLVMEGKAMADIRMQALRKILPYSAAFERYTQSTSYTSMLARLNAKDTRGQRRADMILTALSLIALVCMGGSLFSLQQNGFTSFKNELIAFALSSLFLFLFCYGLFERRYAAYARYKIYTDPTFYRKAMDAAGAVRLFWILQQSEVPNTYELKDFPRISGHIQNEDVHFFLTSLTALREAFRTDTEVIALFKEASIKGYIFTTVTYDEAARALYDTLISNDIIFEQDVADLFTADMHFFDIMHKKYLNFFAITTGTGKERRTLVFQA